MPVLLKRDCWRGDNGYQYCTRSPWNDWFCSCITARRRRRAGRQPMWGTGWATRNGHGEPQYYGPGANGQPQQAPYQTAAPYYYPQQQGGAPPAPPYSPPPAGGYYANQPPSHAGGYEASSPYPQAPQPAYTHDSSRAGDSLYEPPAGPPPGKTENGVVR
ncbi:Chitin synthesis regulation Congo red resistance RCR protein [Lasiodiplodia theobromae]|uniref:Chitin synthesis regulation Congo red resistance RCR protein n=1 Tax=Lasiodiplodia theobromae TaxID=45133 RepID=A0A8H7ISD4_9PEZI|nr:Chitin synthesis regulation Congo red resistance RCR protein [Lasiodiplodia theobromae]